MLTDTNSKHQHIILVDESDGMTRVCGGSDVQQGRNQGGEGCEGGEGGEGAHDRHAIGIMIVGSKLKLTALPHPLVPKTIAREETPNPHEITTRPLCYVKKGLCSCG